MMVLPHFFSRTRTTNLWEGGGYLSGSHHLQANDNSSLVSQIIRPSQMKLRLQHLCLEVRCWHQPPRNASCRATMRCLPPPTPPQYARTLSVWTRTRRINRSHTTPLPCQQLGYSCTPPVRSCLGNYYRINFCISFDPLFSLLCTIPWTRVSYINSR